MAMKNVLVRMDEDLIQLLNAGVSATQLDQSELTRQALRAGVPRVVQGLLQARSGAPQENREAMVDQVRKKAGTWSGFKGAQLLKRTRP